jgi:outer membrane protein assembly factor BamB
MFQHDAQHTGRSFFIGPSTETPEVQIIVEGNRDDDYFWSPVIGSDGTLYLGARITTSIGRKQGLYAFNSDGSQKWFYETLTPNGMPALFEPSNTIYILSRDGILAIDTTDGSLKWKRDFSALYTRQNLIVVDTGILYFVAGCILPDDLSDTCLIALDENGNTIWVYAMEKGETYFDFELPEEIPTGSAGTDYVSSPTVDKRLVAK